MIVEGEYFYKGAMRFSWGFGSPNQLGAFIAGVIPVLWGLTPRVVPAATVPAQLRSSKKVKAEKPVVWPTPFKVLLWLGEFILWLAIGATASRGAAVAGVGAAAAWCLFGFRVDRTEWQKMAGWFGFRAGMCVLGLALFSFGGRIAPGFLAHDDSIGNRFILWHGAATLIAAAPWTGWGVGESGNAFMQWVQTLDRPESYRTMVNSFLHVGVERGLPGLGLFFFLTLAACSWAFVLEKYVRLGRARNLVRAATCVLLSWALSNVFSTLFKDWRLWIFPFIAIGMLLISLVWTRVAARIVFFWIGGLAGSACFLCSVIWLDGVKNNARHVIQLSRGADNLVVLSHEAKAGLFRLGLLLDPQILGPRYGQEVRRWGEGVSQENGSWRVVVFDYRFWRPDSPTALGITRWVLLGRMAALADSIGGGKTIVFMHPTGHPPEDWVGEGTVIFNGVDEDGSRESWMQWAARRKLRIVTVPGIGLDARAQWPAAYIGNFDRLR